MIQPIAIRLFARFRELLDAEILEIALPPDRSIAGIRLQLARQFPDSARQLLEMARFAVNHEFAEEDRIVFPGDDIALIPPVSGG